MSPRRHPDIDPPLSTDETIILVATIATCLIWLFLWLADWLPTAG